MHQLLSDLKTKVLADITLFLDYWYLWIGIVAILIGLPTLHLFQEAHR